MAYTTPPVSANDSIAFCDWPAVRAQLLSQWGHISAQELDWAGPNHRRIALLIQHKCGVAYGMVENYLRNFERTIPLSGPLSTATGRTRMR